MSHASSRSSVLEPSAFTPPEVLEGSEAPEAYRFGELRVLAGIDLLYRGDEVVPLEPRAVRVLRHLVRHAGRVVSKEELLDEVWPETYVTDGGPQESRLSDPPRPRRRLAAEPVAASELEQVLSRALQAGAVSTA